MRRRAARVVRVPLFDRWPVTLALLASLPFSGCASARRSVFVPLIVTEGAPGHHRVEVIAALGDEEETLLLDTGAPSSTIRATTRTSRALSSRPTTSEGVAGVAVECESVVIDDASLGGSRRPPFRASRCPGAGTRNLLGLDVLGARFHIDLRHRVLVLDPPGTPTLPLRRLPAGHVTLPATLGNRDVEVLFDTGADTTVIDARFVALHPASFTLKRSEEGRDVTGHAVPSLVYSVRDLRLGDLVLSDVEVAAIEFPEPMRLGLGPKVPAILGTNVIERAAWTFDLSRHRWSVVPH